MNLRKNSHSFFCTCLLTPDGPSFKYTEGLIILLWELKHGRNLRTRKNMLVSRGFWITRDNCWVSLRTRTSGRSNFPCSATFSPLVGRFSEKTILRQANASVFFQEMAFTYWFIFYLEWKLSGRWGRVKQGMAGGRPHTGLHQKNKLLQLVKATHVGRQSRHLEARGHAPQGCPCPVHTFRLLIKIPFVITFNLFPGKYNFSIGYIYSGDLGLL